MQRCSKHLSKPLFRLIRSYSSSHLINLTEAVVSQRQQNFYLRLYQKYHHHQYQSAPAISTQLQLEFLIAANLNDEGATLWGGRDRVVVLARARIGEFVEMERQREDTKVIPNKLINKLFMNSFIIFLVGLVQLSVVESLDYFCLCALAHKMFRLVPSKWQTLPSFLVLSVFVQNNKCKTNAK